MKINNKILISVLIVLIAAVSLSAVSAADETNTTDVVAVSDESVDVEPVEATQSADDMAYASQQIESVKESDINMGGVISANTTDDENNSTVHDIDNGANISTVEKAIANSTDGDIISFAKDGTYDWHNTNGTNDAIIVDKVLHFVGNNATIKCDNGFTLGLAAAGSTFTGFNFIMAQDVAWNGVGIELLNTKDIAVINCSFKNGNGGIYTQGNSNITITGCSFTGATNETTIGAKKEKGTKAINIMGGSDHFIYDNYFGAGLLDGVSIASNAKNNFQVIGNTFKENYYAIFYGGGVSGVITANNTFDSNIVSDIDLKKAAGETLIENNTFITTTAQPIHIEQGNTAHGAPSTIETITIQNNKFTAAIGIDANPITAVSITSNEGALLPLGTITITNNTFDEGITPLIFMDNSWEAGNGTYIIPAATTDAVIICPTTTISLGKDLTMQLLTQEGVAITNADLTITATSGNYKKPINVTTDDFGLFTISDLEIGNWTFDIDYAGSEGTVGGYTVNAACLEINATVTNKVGLNIKENTIIKGGKLIYTLADSDGNPITNTTITITVNGKEYNKTTDAKGTVNMTINLQPGLYQVMANTTLINSSLKTINYVNVLTNVNTENLVKYYKNGTQFQVTIIDADGNPVGANKTVKFNINGVFYERNTTANGIATLSINLLPNNYTITTIYGTTEVSNQVTVLPTMKTSDLSMTYKDGSKFNATILDGQGKVVANQTVTFNVNGVFYNRTTDANGVASLNINLMSGEYIITSMYNGYEKANKITIKD